MEDVRTMEVAFQLGPEERECDRTESGGLHGRGRTVTRTGGRTSGVGTNAVRVSEPVRRPSSAGSRLDLRICRGGWVPDEESFAESP